jgi:opacity protein-like surface antigen
MRKFVIAAALAASALTAAAPAAAQYYPPQGNAYGYNNYGQVRRLQARVDQIQRQISNLDRRNILSDREANRLREESRGVEYRLRRAARYGLNGREAYDIERQIQRLEIHVQREARDGNRWNNRPYGGYDRDRDGLDDRYERDHGTNYDEDHDRD